MTRVTLLTDFGTPDGYAAAMAGVIAAAAPAAVIETASHEVAHGDVFGAALALSRYALRYPPGTVHLVVVDPGVGTRRRPLAGTLDGRHFVAPDNGVLSLALRDARAVRLVEIADPALVADASATFHGRDIFAPAAARLARGDSLDSLGPEIADPVLLEWPEPAAYATRGPGRGIRGVVVHVDRFGTLITNLPADRVRGESVRVRVEGTEVGPVRRTYGDVAPGEVVALIGSLDLLEVSVRDGSAADRLGAGRGANVVVAPAPGAASPSPGG